MVTRSGLYDFDLTGQEVQRGLPPIVGDEGGSTWLSGGGHFTGSLELDIAADVWIGIDLQPDKHEEQLILGSSTSGGPAVGITVGEADERGALTITLRDGGGRSLVARAHGSEARARRVLFQASPSKNLVSVFENQPWASAPGQPLPVDLVRAESPDRIRMADPYALGGWMVDGEHQGGHSGKVANFFVGTKPLPPNTADRYAAASTNPMGLSYGDLAPITAEMRSRFVRDLRRLRGWCGQPGLSADDLDDASLLLHRWLLDRTAILDVLTRCAGAQLWLPGPSDRALRFQSAIVKDAPIVHIQGEVGPDGPMGFKWSTLSDWRSALAFHANGAPVSREAFIKFVRNKLGSGHYDEDDRKKWQRDLLSVTAGLSVMGQDALAFQMHALLREVFLAVSVSRAEHLATSP